MHFSSLIFALSITFASAQVAPSSISGEDTTYRPLGKFFMFGDSHTQLANRPSSGFELQDQLDFDYVRRLDVVNRGFSGYNTALALRILARQVPPPSDGRINVITVLLGSNDASLPGTPQGLSVEQYSANLKAIITHKLITAHNPVIVVISPPPIDERLHNAAIGSNIRSAASTAQFAAAAKSVAQQTSGVVFIDLWSLIARRAGYTGGSRIPGAASIPSNSKLTECLTSDGLHLSPIGYQIWYDEMNRLLGQLEPEVLAAKMAQQEPNFTDYYKSLQSKTSNKGRNWKA